ncbi:UDP-glucose dehydrogenase family protein [Phreatobacter sp.]|uniref:UDP-glucose dehydrogenase family protein n=1 Tax=Phreatobacter sp. TaxID=1966341 RepID=UPI003F71CCFE
MKVVIIGTGYVGLTTGACLAEIGHDVACIDTDRRKVGALCRGVIPIYEPGLDAMVERNVAAGRLVFDTDLRAHIGQAEVVMIAVGTPPREIDGQADLQYVLAAASEIARTLDHPAVIVTKSTVPAGTGDELARLIAELNPALDFDIASNPEFLREGNAMADFMKPDRIVIGTRSRNALEVLLRLYEPLVSTGVDVIETDIVSSELIKYASNTFLAAKVSFINEMADLCETLGGDVEAVARGMGSDRRIGHAFLRPGPGYGGSCFPKDTRAMQHFGEQNLSPVNIVEAVITVNRARVARMMAKIMAAAGGAIRGQFVALLGLTFKPNTDDVRDSVAILIADKLAQSGATVVAYDPQGIDNARGVLGQRIDYAEDALSAMAGARICVIATDWDDFRSLTPADFERAGCTTLVDLRNLYTVGAFDGSPVSYHSVGRRTSLPAAARATVEAAEWA